MFSWPVIFSIRVTELVKDSSHFPQFIISVICLVRFIFCCHISAKISVYETIYLVSLFSHKKVN